MNKIMNKIVLLMLLTSIGIASVTASQQIITIDVVPNGAGTVQLWKIVNYGTSNVNYGFIGSTKTLGKYNVDTADMVAIIPYNDDLVSSYKLVNMCDEYDGECIKGTYVGYLWDIPEWTVTAYYEIPEDKEKPTVTGIALSTTTPYIGDYITIMVSATDNVGVTKVFAEGGELVYSGSSWNGKIRALYEGTHTINVVAYDGVGNYVQDTSKSYTGKVKPTETPIPTKTPTPSVPFHITKLYLKDIGENWITVNIETTGCGTLGIDIDEARILTREITIEDGGFGTQFKTTPGVHFVCVYDLNNTQNEIVCDSVDVITKLDDTNNLTTDLNTQNKTLDLNLNIGDHGSEKPSKLGPNAIYGLLNIDSSPNNATIYINKANIGLTPKRIDIKPGGHEIRIVKDGYVEYTKKVIVGEGQTVDVIVKLVPLNGTNATTNDTNNVITDSNKQNETLNLSNYKKNTLNNDDKATITIALIVLAVALFGTFCYMYSKSLSKVDAPTDDKKKVDLIEKIKNLINKK